MFDSFFEKLFLRRHLRDQFASQPLRVFFKEKYAIDVGLYSYGCFDPQRIARGTVIGRYCSFSDTCRVLNGNHGLDFLSLHPYLYNTGLGIVDSETIIRTNCVIGDDVWIGHAATILPSVNAIGRGAAIGAGAVVTKNVPPYAIVGGNPARIIRFRFTANAISQIERTQWWKMTAKEIKQLASSEPEMVFKPEQYFSDSNASRTMDLVSGSPA
jgi:acetyltransferase-like isoleucine patch superfamily enzyme